MFSNSDIKWHCQLLHLSKLTLTLQMYFLYSLYSLYSSWSGIFEKKCDGKLVEQFRIKVVSTQQHCCGWHSNIITLQTILTSAASVRPFRWPTISAKLDGKTNLHMKSPGLWMILDYFAAGRSPHSYAGPPTGPGWPILDTGLTWWQVKYIILDILCLCISTLMQTKHFDCTSNLPKLTENG